MNKEQLNNLVKKEWRIPYLEKMMKIVHSFSITEKVIFLFFVSIFIISGLSLLYQVNKIFLVEVPDYGGTLTEGILGSPRFINPVLASSDLDKDLTTLIYSGLLRTNSEGELVNDLAESFDISTDGLTYTFTIRDDAYFHDGKKVTADDVVFTIEKAEDVSLKSPRLSSWEGIKVKKIDDKKVSFTLGQPYSPFIQNLTLGILPKHIWSKATTEEFPFSQFNTKPVGSGPYIVDSITYSGSGLPKEYTLKSFSKYTLGRPFITNIIIKSYTNEKELTEAYKSGDIESLHSISPKQLPSLQIEADDVILSPLPRIFGVFFNQNIAQVLVNKEVRVALDLATDKKAIVESILGGYGEIIDGPVPLNKNANTANSFDVQKAKDLLAKNGWKLNSNGILEKKDKKGTVKLSFSISTGDSPDLKETAYLLQKQWSQIGALVDVKIFEIGDLNQNIIKPRKYDSLLFGEIVGRNFDLYPFWHSSQRNTPGLNIAMYANIKTDKILENIRKTIDKDAQINYLENFNKEIKNDTPAIFTYSPYFIYIVPKKVKNVSLGTLASPAERWNEVFKWYIETNNVWKIFIKK